MSDSPSERPKPPRKPAKLPGKAPVRGPPRKKGATAARPDEVAPVQSADPVEAAASLEITDEEVEGLVAAQGQEEDAELVEDPAEAKAPETALAPRDSLRRYMYEVQRHPLLTREEEHELAVRLREKGDLEAAYRMVTANLRLVVKIAHEYHRSSFALLDLVQEGNVGLMRAVKKFDPYRGVKLSSYAAWWIRAYILRYIMDNWRIVKLGTTQAQRKLFFNLRKEQEKLAASGFEATPKLLAERMNVSEQEVAEMDQRMSHDELSLDAPVSDDGKSTRVERLVGASVPVDERLADLEIQQILRLKLAEFGVRLAGKERYIFENRLTADDPMTLQQIGDHYGLTRERARQIEAALVKELKAWLEKEVPDFKDLEVGPRRE